MENEAAERPVRATYMAEIRGMGFHPPAKLLIERLRGGAKLKLVREPENKYDPNAIKAFIEPAGVAAEDRDEAFVEKLAGYGLTVEDFDAAPEWMLGYIGKEFAAQMAEQLSAEPEAYSAQLCFSGVGKPQAQVKIYEPGR